MNLEALLIRIRRSVVPRHQFECAQPVIAGEAAGQSRWVGLQIALRSPNVMSTGHDMKKCGRLRDVWFLHQSAAFL